MPNNSDKPTASNASSRSVAPLNPNARDGRAAQHVAKGAAGGARQRNAELDDAQRLERGAREHDQAEAQEAERKRMLVGFLGPHDAAEAGDDEHGAADHVPPRRRAEDIEHEIADPRADHATTVADGRTRAGERPSRIGRGVRGEDQREVADGCNDQQPPGLAHEAGKAWGQIGAGICGAAGGRAVGGHVSIQKHQLGARTSRTALYARPAAREGGPAAFDRAAADPTSAKLGPQLALSLPVPRAKRNQCPPSIPDSSSWAPAPRDTPPQYTRRVPI
jgi:hypothetical protein